MRRSKSASKIDRFTSLILLGAVCCIANAVWVFMSFCVLAGATLMFVFRPKETLCLAGLALTGSLFRLHPLAGVALLGLMTLAAIMVSVKRRRAGKAVVAIPRLGHGSADR